MKRILRKFVGGIFALLGFLLRPLYLVEDFFHHDEEDRE